MVTLTEQAAAVYSDYNVLGVASSQKKKPPKPDIRTLFARIDYALLALTAAGGIQYIYATRAALYANLTPAAGAIGFVYGDSDPAKDDFYVKIGGTGTGSWQALGITLSPSVVAALGELSDSVAEAVAANNAAQTAKTAAVAAQVTASAASATATNAAATAVAAAQSSGSQVYYTTKADATAAVGGLPANQVVTVWQDESREGRATQYRVESGVLVFKRYFESIQGITSGTNVTVGPSASTGGTQNTRIGESAGSGASGDYNTDVGRAAGIGSSGLFNTNVGRTAFERGSGNRNVFMSPVSGRDHNGDDNIGIGFAALENTDGNNNIGIGGHAGAPPYTDRLLATPVADYTTNTVTTGLPPHVLDADLDVGKIFRLQFENGTGAVPSITSGSMASVSTLVTLVSKTVSECVWEINDYTMTNNGTPGYIVGLCYSHYDNTVAFNGSSADGSNQFITGNGDARELIPAEDGLQSIGRSPAEEGSYGYRGVRRYRGICARYASLMSNYGENVTWDLGHDTTGSKDFVTRAQFYLDNTNGDVGLTMFNSSGVAIGVPIIFDNSRATIKPRCFGPYADDAAAGAGGVESGELYMGPNRACYIKS